MKKEAKTKIKMLNKIKAKIIEGFKEKSNQEFEDKINRVEQIFKILFCIINNEITGFKFIFSLILYTIIVSSLSIIFIPVFILNAVYDLLEFGLKRLLYFVNKIEYEF